MRPCCSILLLVGLLVVTQTQADAQAPSAVQQVYGLVKAGQFAQAEAGARAALAKDRGNCTLYTLLALAQRGERNLDGAYSSFHKALAICPESLSALGGAAEIAYAQHDAEARPLLEKIVTLDPSNETAQAMLGSLDAAAGNCEGAVQHYSLGGSVVEHNMLATRELAACMVVTGHAPEATAKLKDLLTEDGAPAVRLELARAQHAANQNNEALATLGPLVSSDAPLREESQSALLLAAQIAEADNRTPEAVAWLRRAITVAPKQVESYLFFAEISFNHGSYAVGVDVLNAGLRELPGNARLLLARGVLEVQLSKNDAALTDFEAAHRADPKLSFAEDAIGVLFSQKNDLAAARAYFQQKVKAYPNDPLLQYLYAEVLYQQGTDDASTQTAIDAVRRSIGLEPSYQPARDLLCTLLLRKGDLEGVRQEAHEALLRDPEDETALYQLMRAEHKLDHPQEVASLAERLAAAKRHHQVPVTRYVLQEQNRSVPIAHR